VAPAAVRGDRSATGGVKKERLTEAQLAERMKAMSVKNAALVAAHERSLQDEAAFAQREAAAAEKRRVDRMNRQQMMGERERNRQRKMQALGGREWDAEKKEEDYAPEEARRGAKRGAHGAIVGARQGYAQQPEGRQVEEEDQEVTGARRGGERGRGRGRGRGGRGGRQHDASHPNQQHDRVPVSQAPPTALDFPELPIATAAKDQDAAKAPLKLAFPNKPKEKAPETEEDKKLASEKKAALSKLDEAKHKFGFSPISPGGEKKSWADQVESPT
jgi:hypothetical protein